MPLPNPPRPLDAFKVLDHGAPEETHQLAVGLMNRHRMRLSASASGFGASINATEVSGGLGMLYFAYGAAVEIDSAPLPDFAALHIPLRGRLEFARGDERYVAEPGMGAFFSEHDAVHLRWSADLELLVLRIHRSTLERKLTALTGRRPTAPVVFAPTIGARPDDRPLMSSIMTLQAMVDRFGRDGLPPILATEYEELLLSMLLLDHEHTYSDGVRGHIPALPGRSMRAAVDYIGEHYFDPITATELARAAHVSERTLYDGFQREFGLTPLAFVRRFRLERARDALITSDPSATVAEIALRHGFGHLGRFAASYRERYGESPSETLRRI